MSRKENVNGKGIAMFLCAFHREKTPSLKIWPDGSYFCFGCHARGNIQSHPELESKYRNFSENPAQLRLTSRDSLLVQSD